VAQESTMARAEAAQVAQEDHRWAATSKVGVAHKAGVASTSLTITITVVLASVEVADATSIINVVE